MSTTPSDGPVDPFATAGVAGSTGDPIGDLSDFAPKASQSRAMDQSAVNAVAASTGFASRPIHLTQAVLVRQRRYTTGRNQQLNLKVRAEVMQKFQDLASAEQRPQGELFERMLACYLRERAAGAKGQEHTAG